MSARKPVDAALAYAQAGWPVFPQVPNGKAPAISYRSTHPDGPACPGGCGRDGHGLHDATTDPDKIRYWWRDQPDRNVGIRTGAPGPDVVDVDVRPDGSGMPAWRKLADAGLVSGYQAKILTPSTGMHLYYRGTGQTGGQLRGQHIEMKAQNGCVTAPPSKRAGGEYLVVHHEPGSSATVSWPEIREYLEPQRQERTRDASARPDGETSLDRLAGWLSKRTEGDRNFPTFYAAKQLALAGQLNAAAEERIVQAACEAGLRGGPREARTCIASARRAAARELGPGRPFAPMPGAPGAAATWDQPGSARAPQRQAEAV
jgi:hypothetical protein